MRKLAILAIAIATLFLGHFVVAEAGARCPERTSCASENRSAKAFYVSVPVCISTANWRALNAYWRAEGKTGQCFWWSSSKRGDRTQKIYARCGTITVRPDRAYAYNGRVHWDYFGPFR